VFQGYGEFAQRAWHIIFSPTVALKVKRTFSRQPSAISRQQHRWESEKLTAER